MRRARSPAHGSAAGLPAAGSFAMLLAAAILVGCVFGPLLERGLLQWMYGKDEVVLVLITYAVFLIMEDVIKLVWGVDSMLLPEPYALPGNFSLGGLAYPVYNLLSSPSRWSPGSRSPSRSMRPGAASCCSPSSTTARSAWRWGSTSAASIS